eukprot:4847280-Pyramimonas_sp.AAC.1
MPARSPMRTSRMRNARSLMHTHAYAPLRIGARRQCNAVMISGKRAEKWARLPSARDPLLRTFACFCAGNGGSSPPPPCYHPDPLERLPPQSRMPRDIGFCMCNLHATMLKNACKTRCLVASSTVVGRDAVTSLLSILTS